ncbi:hypothetical protein GGI12_001103 [Dipsacomyces acuminosporus]|nr:hypothetical protein GGI12_001103 [Dipsacomyces acuminosporus]
MFEFVSRGYLPENYYTDKLVYKRKPPQLKRSQYPNKIEVGKDRQYAILVTRSGARLQDAFAWMSTHPYIMVNYLFADESSDGPDALTGNIAIEAYESPERPYVMITFRAATVADEQTSVLMQSHGESQRRGPCPAPVTGLLCRSGVNIQSVWQWLSLHKGRLAYLVNEQFIRNTIAIVRPALRRSELIGTRAPPLSGGTSRASGRPSPYHSDHLQQPSSTYQYALYDEYNTRQARNLQGPVASNNNLQHYLNRQLPGYSYGNNTSNSTPRRRPSHESVDSALPAYEPAPPSIHSSIPEDIRAEISAIEQMQADDASAYGVVSAADSYSMDRHNSRVGADASMGGEIHHSNENNLSNNQAVVCGGSGMDAGADENSSEFLRIVPHGQPLLPPSYWEIAEQTEYGRSFAVTVTPAAAVPNTTENTDVEMGEAAETLESTPELTAVRTAGSSLSYTSSVESSDLSIQMQIQSQCMPGSSQHVVPAEVISAAALLSPLGLACAPTEAKASDNGNIISVPSGCSSSASTSSRSSMLIQPGARLGVQAEERISADDSAPLPGITRTFTQSLPALNGLLSDEGTMAAIEEARRQAIVRANRDQAGSGESQGSQNDNASVVSLRSVSIDSGTFVNPSNARYNLCINPGSSSNGNGNGNGSGYAMRRQERQASNGSSGSGSGMLQSLIFRGFNEHVRRSRLSAKTNPEYGAKRNWFSKLLHM